MTNITVKELAQRICRPNEEMSAVVERLRNWTKEGLLETVGDKNPGTGRPRRYDNDALTDALILTTLADIGIPSVRASQLRHDRKGLLSHARLAFDMAKAKPDLPAYLVIRRNYEASGRSSRYTTEIYVHQLEPKNAIGIRAVDGVFIPDNAETVVVINITALVKRINPPMGE